jgi:hypothetical protein
MGIAFLKHPGTIPAGRVINNHIRGGGQEDALSGWPWRCVEGPDALDGL